MESAAPPLPQDVFALVVRSTPLLSIDLLVRDDTGAMLLGWRRNRPARDCWFVPGGRVRKGETLDEAFTRIARSELGTALSRRDSEPAGVYEHFYQDHYGGEEFGTHYVVLAYAVRTVRGALQPPPARHAEAQHAEYAWFSAAELRSRADIHPYSRAYAALAVPPSSVRDDKETRQ